MEILNKALASSDGKTNLNRLFKVLFTDFFIWFNCFYKILRFYFWPPLNG